MHNPVNINIWCKVHFSINIANIFSITMQLTNHQNPLIIPVIKIGGVSAGFPSPALDYMQDVISLDREFIKNPLSTFLVQVIGDSMINAFVPPGAWLIVDKSLQPNNMDIVVAVIDGEFTCKHYKKENGRSLLIPANPKYKPIEILEFTNCSIWGVVISVIHCPKPTMYVRFS